MKTFKTTKFLIEKRRRERYSVGFHLLAVRRLRSAPSDDEAAAGAVSCRNSPLGSDLL